MAKRAEKKAAKKRGNCGRRWAAAALLCVLALIAGLFGWMYGCARVTRVCPAEVYLEDLPASMDGVKLLFISDFNMKNAADAANCAHLLKKLEPLGADVLLLGGDYASGAEGAAAIAQLSDALARFPAAMGKFAVAGERDEPERLAAALEPAGVQLLQDACVTLERGGGQLIIAGLNGASGKITPYAELGRYFNGDECVIALAHNPSAYVGVRVAEARGGGNWADLVLSGHNLGGQIRLFGRTIHSMPEEESRTLAGWFYGDDLPLLVSQGLACRDVPLRLGTRSEVWLITLRRPMNRSEMSLPDFAAFEQEQSARAST